MVIFDDTQQNKDIEDLRSKEEEELVRMLAQTKYNTKYIDLSGIVIDNEALRFITEEDGRKSGIAPFKLVGKTLKIAVRDPSRQEVADFKQMVARRGYNPEIFMTASRSLEKVWTRYKEISFATTSRVGGLDVSGDTIIELGQKIKTSKDIIKIIEAEKESKSYTVSKILEIIMAGAISLSASDVHIEATDTGALIRYRLDGVLNDVSNLDAHQYKLINSRIKLLSGMKLTSIVTAQDGRFSIFVKGSEINIRTSTVPSAYGESIVMRLLNPKSIQVTIEDLGVDPVLYKVLMREIEKPHGFILITGPTGSGKTTTLYAFLQKIYSSEIKIITVEDPIEYHLSGITQTQVDTKKDFTFLSGLRAALRQDPEVIMVGEIRDHETAEIAVNASLTGHMVFSTLHTNNAAGVIPRMLDLKISPKILPSALSVSLAQRLVRKLCKVCKKERKPTPEEETDIRNVLKKATEEGKNLEQYGVKPDQEIVLYDPVGCEACNFIGYKGRVGVFEAILTDEAIEKLIVTEPSERDIKKAAQKQGLLDMKEDGVVKILQGVTSLSEVKSVVDFYED